MPRWAPGFREKIEAITGEREFTYCLAVTRLHGDASARCLLKIAVQLAAGQA